jgi:hypothetical protein
VHERAGAGGGDRAEDPGEEEAEGVDVDVTLDGEPGLRGALDRPERLAIEPRMPLSIRTSVASSPSKLVAGM